MADKIYVNSRFCYREDTLANWQINDPVLEQGEIAFVRDGTDGKFVKIGDGKTPWALLPYAPLPKGEKGACGEKGEKGDPGTDGKDAVTELHYSPTSPNAQSGKAVAEALTEEWVQIADDTLEQDSILIYDKDIDGNPLNIKKFMIVVFHKAKEGDTTNNCLWLHIKVGDNYKLAGNTSSYAKNIDSTHKITGEIWQNWRIEGAACSGLYTTVAPSYRGVECIYGCRPEILNYRDPITSMRLTYATNGSLNAGSKIEIWGLKA